MLKDALDKATVASKAKGEFLSNTSHEIRTPLNAIIGMTAIAKNAPDLERKNYALNKIENASTHLLGVINDVLDMSKIEANKLELSFVEFNFEKMLQKAVSVITFRVDEKHQKLSFYIDNKIPYFLIGDDQRLTQVITNLLGNAVKFTPENGSVSLNAYLLKEENNICTIKISVSDTGIGMTKEQKNRLFQSFQQAEASTVRKYGGTGLGLAISKKIIEMMNGNIWVESEEGKGSVFSFTIEAMRGKGNVINLNERSGFWENIRTLVIDNDREVLGFFRDISQRYGFYCDTVTNAEDALRLVERNGDYNIYIIDWKMPGIDGITLSSALKSMEHKSGQPVIVMISVVEWSEIKDAAKKAGVDKFLPKPLFPSAVVEIFYECFSANLQIKKDDQNAKSVSYEGHNILLAEDLEINREIVITILEPLKLGIDCALDGIKTVEMYRENPEKYDLIFMDVQMPEMDGYEATRQIRVFEEEQKKNGKTLKRIPIVAMTANVFKEDIDKCINSGMDDHLAKPLDFEIVMEKLRTYIK
jgi:CheY-like chemotaxis protein